MEDTRILVLVHPGSACGSADFHHGRSYASSERDMIIGLLSSWDGGMLVVDSDLSDEIAQQPRLETAIAEALRRAKATGHSTRLLAGDGQCDYDETDWVSQVVEHVLRTGIRRAVLTGAWYHRDDDGGCVNAVYDELVREGISVVVDDSALSIDMDD